MEFIKICFEHPIATTLWLGMICLTALLVAEQVSIAFRKKGP